MKSHANKNLLRLVRLDGQPVEDGATIVHCHYRAHLHITHKHVARTYVVCIAVAFFLEGCAYAHKVRLTGEDVLTGFVLALTSIKEIAHLILTRIWDEMR